MTHEEYESIAALDVLGVITTSDAAILGAHLSGCIPCRHARDEYAEAATLLARGLVPVAPPRVLRAAIMESVTRAVPKQRGAWWFAAAATLLIGIWVWREGDQRASITALRQQNEKLSAAMNAIASEGTRTIALAGQEVAPSASAKVFLEPDRRRAIVFFYDLPPNPGDKSYQLWIIRADQPKPMSAGVFDVTKSGTASITIENLPVATEMKALAVTLEPKGGAPQPTNTRFYVAGSADL